MIVLDENLPDSQRRLLRSWRIRVQQVGHELGRPGMRDAEIVPFLGDLASLAGVYFLQSWQMIETRDAVDLTLLFDQADPLAIVGMAVTMIGISIAIALKPPRLKGPPTLPYREAWRRPSQVTLCDNGCEKSLLLSWPAEYSGDSTPVFADRRDICHHAIAE